MKIGDRVKSKGFNGERWSTSPSDGFIIIECNIPNGHYNMCDIKNLTNNNTFSVFDDEIVIDVEYYRDLKIKELLDENRG